MLMKTHRNCSTKQSTRCRGVTLVEVIVSGILLGAVTMVAVPTLGWIARERRAADRRQEAIAELENVMDRFSARPWQQITPEGAARIALSESTRRQLPGAMLQSSVETNPQAPDEKQIRVELSWQNRIGKQMAPQRLTAWVYRTGRTD